VKETVQSFGSRVFPGPVMFLRERVKAVFEWLTPKTETWTCLLSLMVC